MPEILTSRRKREFLSTALVKLEGLPPQYDAGLICSKCGCLESTTSYRNPEIDPHSSHNVDENRKQIFTGYLERQGFRDVRHERTVMVRAKSWWRNAKYATEYYWERQAVKCFDPQYEYVEVLHKSCAKCGYTWQEMTKDFVMPTRLPILEGEGNMSIFGEWVTNPDGTRTQFKSMVYHTLEEGDRFSDDNKLSPDEAYWYYRNTSHLL